VQELVPILVVEDDHDIQGVIEETLSEAGFEPTITASGEEAMTLLQGNEGQHRALVIDVTLIGKLDGWQVAKKAREIDPEFPVIYMTGSNAHEWGANGVPNSILLNKPFAPAQLITALSQLLNAAGPPAEQS
jgi:DNA-binding response OmpR family regulator